MKSTEKQLRNLTRKGRGRIKGALNKITQEAAALGRAYTSEDKKYMATLKKRLRAGKAPHMELLLWHYGHGKPTEKLKIEDNRKPTLLNIGLVPQLPSGD